MSSSVSLRRRLAGSFVRSPLLAGARALAAANERDWQMPLSRLQKVRAGLYFILRDYADGAFPPSRTPRETAVESELGYRQSLPGMTEAAVDDMHMRKPFWTGSARQHIDAYLQVAELLAELGVLPPARVLEIGCGSGWLSEMLALQRYDVVGTTLVPGDVRLGELRVASLAAKKVDATLAFRASAMEDLDATLADLPPFDAALVYEALHHAFDWRRALAAAHARLRDGGWLLVCSEPNRSHTFVAYRAARLSGTQEIGFSRRQLVDGLRAAGFREIRVVRNRLHFGVRPHWIAARR